MWLTRPSTGPELQGMVRPLVTASRSCFSPLANDEMPGSPASLASAIHWGLAGELGEHAGECADLVRCCLQLGAAVQDGREPGFLVLGQGVRAAGQPVRNVPDGGRGLGKRCPRGADLVEVVADDGVAAVVAEVADLAEQAGEAAVSLAGVLVQVGLERVEFAGARCLPPAVDEFLPGGGAVVTLDGVQPPSSGTGRSPAGRAPRPAGHGPGCGCAWCARRSPRPDAAGESPAQRHPGMTSTRRLATMTPRTPGRTAGLDKTLNYQESLRATGQTRR